MNETHEAPLRLRAVDYPDETLSSLAQRLQRTAMDRPDHVAIIDGDRRFTWREADAAIAAVRRRLTALGVGRGAHVASLAENSAEHLVLYLGVVTAGACMVPMPSGAHPDTLRKLIADSGAALLFHSPAQSARARTAADDRAGLPLVDLDGLAAWAEGGTFASEPAGPSLDDPFDMIYSSGTTGLPKGIVHDHRFRLRHVVRMSRFGLDGDAVFAMATPLYSNTTLVALLPVVAGGGTVVVMRKFDARGFLELCERHAISHTMLVPVQYARILAVDDFERFDLSSFRAKLSTSAPFPPHVVRDALARWPGRLINSYGLTEGGVSAILDCTSHSDKLHTVGRPVEGCEVLILSEAGEALPQGEVGEVVGRSWTVMTHYHNAPDKTAEIRWQGPNGEDFIRTGDMGRLDEDGFLQLLDRRKDMILSGGFNIYAADLEEVLLRHEAVDEAAVIAVPSQAWGETPLALVVLRPGASITPQALLAFANEQLGKTQRLQAVEVRTQLPRSEIGKVLKRELRAPYWPAPSPPGP